jgi:hypothetical protein
VGGAAVLVALAIHIILNMVLKEFPPESATATELQAYLALEGSTWAIVHGFRYVAFACLVLFAAALSSRITAGHSGLPNGWAVVGLLGTAMWVTNGVITNGIEMLAFVNHEAVSDHEELFWLLFYLTRVLFTAEIATWAIAILGFSMAGRASRTMSDWLWVLGLFAALTGLLSGVFVVSVINGGWATILADIATISSLAWFLCVGIVMVR